MIKVSNTIINRLSVASSGKGDRIVNYGKHVPGFRVQVHMKPAEWSPKPSPMLSVENGADRLGSVQWPP